MEGHNPNSKKTIIIAGVGIGILLIILLGVFLFLGSIIWKDLFPEKEPKTDETVHTKSNEDKEEQKEISFDDDANPKTMLEDILEEEDTEKLANILHPADKDMQMDDEAMEAFIRFFNEDESEKDYLFNSMENQLNSGEAGVKEDSYVSIVETDDGDFNNQYNLVVNPVYFRFYVDYPGTIIKMNEEKIYEMEKGDDYTTKQFGPFVPGLYEFTAEYESPLDTTYTVEYEDFPILNPNDSFNVSFDFDDWEQIDIFPYKEDLNAYNLFIDGDLTNEVITKDNESIIVDKNDKTHKGYLVGNFPWGKMKSEKFKLSGHPADDIQFHIDDKLKKELKKLIIQFNKNKIKTIETMDKKDIAPYASEIVTDTMMKRYDAIKGDGDAFKGFLQGIDFYPETINIEKTSNTFRTLFVTHVNTKEGQPGDKKSDLEENSQLVAFELSYDEKEEKWEVTDFYTEDFIKDEYPDIDFDKADKEKYKEKNPKVYETK